VQEENKKLAEKFEKKKSMKQSETLTKNLNLK
jgi:hypothetical protein